MKKDFKSYKFKNASVGFSVLKGGRKVLFKKGELKQFKEDFDEFVKTKNL